MSSRLPSPRYILVALVTLVAFHYTFRSTSSTYAETTSFDAVRTRFAGSGSQASWVKGKPATTTAPHVAMDRMEIGGDNFNVTRKANAAFVILARNSDLWEILGSIRGMEGQFKFLEQRDISIPHPAGNSQPQKQNLYQDEVDGVLTIYGADRFNHKYNYPYVFINDEPFSDEFKKHTSGIASGVCTYGVIPSSEWNDQPSWIDQEKAKSSREAMEAANVIYGGSLTYRKMCRYQSGFFWRHPLLDSYEYYWRIEFVVSQSAFRIDPDAFRSGLPSNSSVTSITIHSSSWLTERRNMVS